MSLATREERHAVFAMGGIRSMLPIADGSGADTEIQRGIFLLISAINGLPDPTPPNEGSMGFGFRLDMWE